MHWRLCQECPNIVQIVEVYENFVNNSMKMFVLMELIEGGELFNRIQERTKRPLTEKEVSRIMFQICTAVKHLHDQDIAHRDIKPENLLLTSNDENAVLKLTDFGFAKQVKLGLKTPW